MGITWTCEVCGGEKPDREITVTKYDFSHYYDLPADTMQRNVRHCFEPACIAAAKDESMWAPKGKATGEEIPQ